MIPSSDQERTLLNISPAYVVKQILANIEYTGTYFSQILQRPQIENTSKRPANSSWKAFFKVHKS